VTYLQSIKEVRGIKYPNYSSSRTISSRQRSRKDDSLRLAVTRPNLTTPQTNNCSDFAAKLLP